MRTLVAKFSNITNLKNYHLGKKKAKPTSPPDFQQGATIAKSRKNWLEKNPMLMPYSRQ